MSARTGLPKLVRSLESRSATVVFLTVPDRAVAGVAAKLAAGGAAIPKTVAFVHASGALELGALDALRARHAVGSFHPLRSFPEPGPPEAFRGIVVAVDASSAALMRNLDRLARDLGARPRRVDDRQRALYHVAAVLASNYVVALLGEAIGLLEQSGWTEKGAARGLIPLAEGALANVRKRGPAAALTGPIRRGDAVTVSRHLEALAQLDAKPGRRRGPPEMDVYRMLGQVALEFAQQAGLEPAAAEQTRRALTRKVAATRRRSRA
ncbi:MAG: DUF2520 domain-containing protein [Candidatus Dormibacteraeota bacterium]|nr:DUF2520 domain-containing protein [Candidatus Dormibacteraeota bacterium]